MANNTVEKTREYLRYAGGTVKKVVSPRWGVSTIVSSLVALGALSSVEPAIAKPLLIPYGIGACAPEGDEWNPTRHRDIGFIFAGNQGNPVLVEGRALTITDVRERRLVVTRFQPAGKRADSWTTVAHGGASDIFGRRSIEFKDGHYYLAELWETDNPGGIKMGQNSLAIVPFAGCPSQ